MSDWRWGDLRALIPESKAEWALAAWVLITVVGGLLFGISFGRAMH